MKRLRTVSIMLFLASVILFGIYWYIERIAKDQSGPVFHMESDVFTVSVSDNEKALLDGITATDANDGDVSESIIVEAVSPFTGTGHRIVNYVAFDSDNHVTHAKRELIYSDYTDPKFSLSKPLSFPMNSTNILDGIKAIDCIDGDITRSIRLLSEDEIDTAHVGYYNARLKVSNSAGGVSYLPVTIEIYDAATKFKGPQIKLRDYIVYIEKDSYFDEEEYVDSIIVNGTEYDIVEGRGSYGASYVSSDMTDDTISIDDVGIESEVDTSVTGCYEVIYTFEDTVSRTGTDETRLYVVVTEGGAN